MPDELLGFFIWAHPTVSADQSRYAERNGKSA